MHDSSYLILKIWNIFYKLSNGFFFCSLDIFTICLNLAIDEDSMKIKVILMHHGTNQAKDYFLLSQKKLFLIKLFLQKAILNKFHAFIDQFI